ncbi:nuclear transport factor 2 family protein, partial [Actinomyces oris]
SPALTVTGTADIAEHINRVHNDRIAGQGLIFSYDQRMESGDALLLRWSMTAPSGDVVGRGVDTVFRDVDGKVTRAYMFMGVN